MDWYHDEVRAAIKKRMQCPYQPGTIFYGSSTITLWETLHEDFAAYAPLNLGFWWIYIGRLHLVFSGPLWLHQSQGLRAHKLQNLHAMFPIK